MISEFIIHIQIKLMHSIRLEWLTHSDFQSFDRVPGTTRLN